MPLDVVRAEVGSLIHRRAHKRYASAITRFPVFTNVEPSRLGVRRVTCAFRASSPFYTRARPRSYPRRSSSRSAVMRGVWLSSSRSTTRLGPTSRIPSQAGHAGPTPHLGKPCSGPCLGMEHANRLTSSSHQPTGSDDAEHIATLLDSSSRARRRIASRYRRVGGRSSPPPSIRARADRRVFPVLVRSKGGVERTTRRNSFKRTTVLREDVGSNPRWASSADLERVAKAGVDARPVADIPTIWRDRAAGQSTSGSAWIPSILRWSRDSFGPEIT